MKTKNLENTILEKEKIIQEIHKAEEDIRLLKFKIKEKETDLWTNTDFKHLGYTNKDTRRAYVQKCLIKYKSEKEEKDIILKNLKRRLEVCDDKIKLFS